ncbi:hypothetical protein Syun_002608 [Stephania yunnanensis]|uniref:Uncharacterized protein n=1 Tax=Stephania yunnanensis TaxID=152371 RepID=A0AAP0Q872_9MAGN
MEMEMENGREEETQHSFNINISQVQLNSIKQNIAEKPRGLCNWAGNSSCSIYKVPQSLVCINHNAYHPQIVSIGPYHKGKPNLDIIQEHKWKFLGSLLSRTRNDHGLELEDYFRVVKSLETKIRESYSEHIELGTDELVEIMVLDGCFVVELFRIMGGLIAIDSSDPIFVVPWVFPCLARDLVRLENQIPFFVLEALFDLSNPPRKELQEQTTPSLALLALRFFNYIVQRNDEVIEQHHSLKAKHLLDLLSHSFIVPRQIPQMVSKSSSNVNKDLLPVQANSIPCLSKLRRSGIKFIAKKTAESFLDIRFIRGVLEIPTVTIDDFMCSFLLNCVAYEQCHKHCSKHMTTYATFMDFLIDTPRDVGFLCDSNIIENYFGTDVEVASFFNNMGKEVVFDIELCYIDLPKLFGDVNEYYRSSRRVAWASFKYTYFSTPWSFISALAAAFLLVLTVLQTYFTMYAYFRPPN